VAGVVAHYPTLLPIDYDQGQSRWVCRSTPEWPEASVRAAWRRLAEGVVDVDLGFEHTHSLMGPDSPRELREAPFYLNFGVVFFPRGHFDRIAPYYLRIRPLLETRMRDANFSGQAALTLAIAATGAGTRALPLRYNFPNDPAAVSLHPGELDQVVIHHYLRTGIYDRHRIFVSAEEYQRFLARPLDGLVDQRFQAAVRRFVGDVYPFD
jgi:hypothetical protein